MLCLKNSQFIDSISIFDRAFHYGDGCFSTARFHKGVFELEFAHRKRLIDSAHRLLLDVDFTLLDQSIGLLHQKMGVLNGTLKIILSRGEGNRGYALPDHPADMYVLFYPQETSSFEFAQINSGVLQQKIGLNMPELVGIKTLNRLEQVMLKQEALQKQWQEALVCDLNTQIVEGVSSNCFLRINNTWVTPELRYNGVHGVMRAEILKRMQQHHIPCERRLVDLVEIQTLQSLFFCNALSPMKAVSTWIDDADEYRLLDLQPCVELFETLKLNQFNSYVQSNASIR